MYELARILPTADALLALEPDALGTKILAVLCNRPPNQNQGMFHLNNLIQELWPFALLPGQQSPFPQNRRSEIDLAIGEAWAWLQREGLLIPASDINGHNGWLVLSRRARGYVQTVDLSGRAAPVPFPKEFLHPRILDRAWPAYIRTDFDNAAFEAMKSVEVAVREAAGYGPEKIGVNLSTASTSLSLCEVRQAIKSFCSGWRRSLRRHLPLFRKTDYCSARNLAGASIPSLSRLSQLAWR